MQTLHTVTELRAAVRTWRAAGERVAFVPTMGNLHAGHIHLIAEARARAPRVVASVFVNPLQFGPSEDFDKYPRTLAADAERLAAADCDLLFAPAVEEMYPGGREAHTVVTVPALSDILCGAFRPGHFAGVATVVAKLFGLVQPDVALFGEKDFQQLLVIRRMSADLGLPVEIVGIPTVREADGLAMSSRNQYLGAEERSRAALIYKVLQEAARALGEGARAEDVEARGLATLSNAGFRPDYLAVRAASDLGPPRAGEPRVVLVAAWLGKARLIDNLRF
jgi:pantoate--beta-alanine ligase